MAGEIQFSYLTGATTYAVIRNRSGQLWNNTLSAFEAFNALNITAYATAAVEQGATGYYVGNFPTAIPPGTYSLVAKLQLNVNAQVNDATIATGQLEWNGTTPVALADLATSGLISLTSPVKVYRGEMISNFPFKLVSSADHVTPFTSGVVSGQVSRDGAAFVALQSGAFTEVGKGWYATTLTSGDLSASTVALVFTANGISGGSADQRDHSFILQRVSGYT